jgi:tripartite-type tricarboxylate transporter receptor subunit TctC
VNALLKDPQVVEVLGKQGLVPTGGSEQELADLTRNDFARWAKVVRDAHIPAD